MCRGPWLRLCGAIAAAALACAKPPPPKPPPPPPDPKEELKLKIKELYSTLEQQEPERLNQVLTADAMVFGLGPKEAFTLRDLAIEAMRTELIPFGLRGDVFKVASSEPRVEISGSEQAGWFYDFPKVERIRAEKAPQAWKARVTGYAVRAEGKWRIDALHISFGFPDADLYSPDASKTLKLPLALGSEKGVDSEQLLGLTRRLLEDIALKVDRTSDSEQVVLIGTDPMDVYEGGKKFKELARPKLPELKKAAFSLKIEDGPRARLGPDKKSGWVSATVVLRLGKPPKVQVLPAFRALWIYAEEKDVWNLVSEHQSLGLTAEQRKPNANEGSSTP